MIMTALMVLAAAPPAQAPPARAASEAMSVGAIVVPEAPAPRPVVAVERGAIVVRNVEGVAVSAAGGSVRRTGAATIVVAAGGAGPVTVTLTY